MLERENQDDRSVKFSSRLPENRSTCDSTRSSSDESDEGIGDWSRTVGLEDTEDLVTYLQINVSCHDFSTFRS